ncbi:hypothetical protein [Arthrobacter sp. SRS-W-1-2016]|uniref:hypothetical protein n=1 Tax=Arthrobacter sp. SRS-W-1-2016 TaxID=1930254 RepID=UPI000990FE5C|nr:hypothetical protein [Arthrobacter sp. SRS-W-1-2016]
MELLESSADVVAGGLGGVGGDDEAVVGVGHGLPEGLAPQGRLVAVAEEPGQVALLLVGELPVRLDAHRVRLVGNASSVSRWNVPWPSTSTRSNTWPWRTHQFGLSLVIWLVPEICLS